VLRAWGECAEEASAEEKACVEIDVRCMSVFMTKVQFSLRPDELAHLKKRITFAEPSMAAVVRRLIRADMKKETKCR
jgi:hypothetical protein